MIVINLTLTFQAQKKFKTAEIDCKLQNLKNTGWFLNNFLYVSGKPRLIKTTHFEATFKSRRKQNFCCRFLKILKFADFYTTFSKLYMCERSKIDIIYPNKIMN